jgi:hypothetical protein
MLECTWNDSESATALRRLLLKEQKQEKLLANNPKRNQKIRESALARLALKRIAGTANYHDTL